MSSSATPWLVLGGVAVAGVAIFALASKDHAKTVDQEAQDAFPSPYGRDPSPGQRALKYKASVARRFYRELRQQHSPDDAERITRIAMRREGGWLNGMARRGASVNAGATQLRAHAPTVYAR